MTKLAFVFPGQGSQYIGMGKDFYDNFTIARDIFDVTNKTLGYDLSDIIFNGNEEQLTQTEITQPAIYTISYIIYKILEQKGLKPDFLAGHSLGEYVALTASGILSFEDGINLVKKRGEFIKDACSKNLGGMIAILGLSNENVENIVKNLDNVEIANYNSSIQTVISYKGDDNYADEIISQIKAKRLVRLNVSGPFHSSYMQSASDSLKSELNSGKYQINLPKTPIIFNYSAKADFDLEIIKSNIINQVKASVQWVKSVEYMGANGVSAVVEVGPGKVLSGLNKKINSNFNILNVENIENIENVSNLLEEFKICQKN